MNAGRIVGIDLGTTNSLVAYMQGDTPVVIPGEDGSNLVPSIVALDETQSAHRGKQRAALFDRNAGAGGVLDQTPYGARG